MVTKIRFLLVLLLIMLSNSSLFAQAWSDIPLRKEMPQNDSIAGRSSFFVPEAYIIESTITINYPILTMSQVIVRDAETGAVVYSASYDATRQVIVNLSSLPEGLYELHLYAFGKRWWGEFEIQTEDY